MKVREIKTLAEFYVGATWKVETITRRETGFRCELSRCPDAAYDHRITLHSDAPLNWEHDYTWEELQAYPLWLDGVKAARPDRRAARKPRPPRPVRLRLV